MTVWMQQEKRGAAQPSMHTGLLHAESVEEYREQLEIAMREASILKEEVDTLAKENNQLQHIAADRDQIARSVTQRLAQAEDVIKEFKSARSGYVRPFCHCRFPCLTWRRLRHGRRPLQPHSPHIARRD